MARLVSYVPRGCDSSLWAPPPEKFYMEWLTLYEQDIWSPLNPRETEFDR